MVSRWCLVGLVASSNVILTSGLDDICVGKAPRSHEPSVFIKYKGANSIPCLLHIHYPIMPCSKDHRLGPFSIFLHSPVPSHTPAFVKSAVLLPRMYAKRKYSFSVSVLWKVCSGSPSP